MRSSIRRHLPGMRPFGVTLLLALGWMAAANLGVGLPLGVSAAQEAAPPAPGIDDERTPASPPSVTLVQAPSAPAGQPTVDLEEAARQAHEALEGPSGPEPAAASGNGGEPAAAAPNEKKELNLMELMFGGSWLMTATVVPILMMSLVVTIFGIERLLGLRKRKVLPPQLVEALGEAASSEGGLDPRQAYKICQQYPSALASVIRAALLKVGRPLVELEHAVKDANEREAGRLYNNVRPLSLAAAISPLLGLLGTVIGMIMAFFETASGNVSGNKAAALAEGIYTALVTTFLGLVVAIPAAMLAHWFEGRIQRLFLEIDELLMALLPQLERYEGKLRLQRKSLPTGNAASTASAAKNGEHAGSAAITPAAHD